MSSVVAFFVFATPVFGADTDVATDLNQRLNSVNILDDYFMMHIMEPDRSWPEPYYADPISGRQASSLFNSRSWNPDTKQYDVFTFYTTLTGTIAFDSAIEATVACMFPSDADSDDRSNGGCGCGRFKRCQSDGYDWCDAYYPPKQPGGTLGNQCALRANQTTEMLQAWNEQAHTGNSRSPSGNKWTDYTEVVVDGVKWNSTLNASLRAFVVLDECDRNDCCYTDFQGVYAAFKARFGSRPVLGMDLKNQETPFRVLSEPEEPAPADGCCQIADYPLACYRKCDMSKQLCEQSGGTWQPPAPTPGPAPTPVPSPVPSPSPAFGRRRRSSPSDCDAMSRVQCRIGGCEWCSDSTCKASCNTQQQENLTLV